MAIPIYIHLRNPSRQQIFSLICGVIFSILIAVLFLHDIYGHIIGKAFDDQSKELLHQLDIIKPGISEYAYPLSIINEAGLFFVYGLLWFFPNVGWMSIDLRPSFPLSFFGSFHAFGAIVYIVLFFACFWLLIKRRGYLSLLAIFILFLLITYITEFSTVWIQDPFVLYRSYLWGLGVAGLTSIALIWFNSRSIYFIGLIFVIVFGGLTLERISSLKNAGTAWEDAAKKINLSAPNNAVGRSRAFLNLGSYRLEKGMYDQAILDFQKSEALGDADGSARFSIGVALQLKKQHIEALKAFESARIQGYQGQMIDYHRGESYLALGEFDSAYKYLGLAIQKKSDFKNNEEEFLQVLRVRHGESAIGARKYADAAEIFGSLHLENPDNYIYELNLGMALVGSERFRESLNHFDKLIKNKPHPGAYYGRAIAYYQLGEGGNALFNIEQAVKNDPKNSAYRVFYDQIKNPK